VKPSPRSFSFALLTFLWLSSSGCEMEHGKGGFIDRATAEDLEEQAETCADGERWRTHDPSIDKCADRDPRPGCRPGCYPPAKAK